MASDASASNRQMSIGRVFSRAFATIAARPVTMFGIAFLFGALPKSLLTVVLQLGGVAQRFSMPRMIGVWSGGALLAVACGLLTQGALVRVMVAEAEGHSVGFGAAMLTGLRKILPLLALAILLGIAVTVGLALLIVPGIILYMMWSVAAPALVEERCGVFGAFGRSAALTKGARWSIFAIELMIFAFYYTAAAVLGVAAIALYGGLREFTAANQTGIPILLTGLNVIFYTVINTLNAAVQTSLYVELRDWKDGPASEALSDIFE